jgi:hypothetical protein
MRNQPMKKETSKSFSFGKSYNTGVFITQVMEGDQRKLVKLLKQ